MKKGGHVLLKLDRTTTYIISDEDGKGKFRIKVNNRQKSLVRLTASSPRDWEVLEESGACPLP